MIKNILTLVFGVLILGMMVALIFGVVVDTASAATGEEIFAQSECTDCHYEDDFSGEAKEDIASWLTEIVNGAKHKVDLSFTSEEIDQLAEYLSSVEIE